MFLCGAQAVYRPGGLVSVLIVAGLSELAPGYISIECTSWQTNGLAGTPPHLRVAPWAPMGAFLNLVPVVRGLLVAF